MKKEVDNSKFTFNLNDILMQRLSSVLEALAVFVVCYGQITLKY